MTEAMMKKHRSRILESAKIDKVPFDATNKDHLESLRKFLRTGTWGDVRFTAELPHVEVPMTVLVKLAKHCLGEK